MIYGHMLVLKLISALLVQNDSPGGGGALESLRSDADCRKEESLEARCIEAFRAVHHFEHTHSLAVQNMGMPYLQQRADLIDRTTHLVETLGSADDAAHDAVLLMDRVMSSSMKVCTPPPPHMEAHLGPTWLVSASRDAGCGDAGCVHMHSLLFSIRVRNLRGSMHTATGIFLMAFSASSCQW